MPRAKQSQGKCNFCGKQMAKAGLTRHLPGCAERQQAISQADQKPGTAQNLYHLQVRDAYNSDFWLHLEVNGTTTLNDLDRYLRAIWLECCGHMSQFSVGGWSGDEISMKTRIERVFKAGVELTHIYDFGTSSETLVKVVTVRKGKPLTQHPIYLMARNDMPEATCMECDQPAKWLCIECISETDESGLLCDVHVESHPHQVNYGEPEPLYNSPRMGVCGYEGPAEPPY